VLSIDSAAGSNSNLNENATPTPTPTSTPTPTPVHESTSSTTPIKESTAFTTSIAISPVAAFTASPISGNIPLAVIFTDQSTGSPTSWSWDFGDNREVDTIQSPKHIFMTAGTFTVNLTASNANGVSSTSVPIVVSSNTVPINLRVLCSGIAPCRVHFIDRSKRHISYYWDFGDGNTSRSKSITHIYETPGKYLVKLTYMTTGHSTKTLYGGYIVVNASSYQPVTIPTLTPTSTPTSTPITTPTSTLPTTGGSNSVYISALYVGAPHETKDQEYVQITNTGTNAVNLNSWKITDEGAKHTYTFPSYALSAGSTVTLISGLGTNSADSLYWNKDIFIWNNDGNTAYLYNAQGTLVSQKNG